MRRREEMKEGSTESGMREEGGRYKRRKRCRE